MGYIPDEIEESLKLLQKLPGYGERSASRFLYALLKLNRKDRFELVKVLAGAAKNLRPCSECGIYTDKDVCDICSSEERNKKLITVVEESSDAYTIERTGKYKGVYHVLGGRISPLEGISPEDLNIEPLFGRIERYRPIEVVLATNPNAEGEATASYLAKELKRRFPDLRVSRIGFGAAFGTYLELLEEFTLSEAIERRKEYKP